MATLSSSLTILYTILYPIVYVLRILSLILTTAISPLVYLGHYLLRFCWYPFHILGKFEALYIFFGVALVIGILAGTSLHYVSTFIQALFDLDSPPKDKPVTVRSLATYRLEKQGLMDRGLFMERPSKGGLVPINDSDLTKELKEWDWANEDRGRPRNGVLHSTILEEDDSSLDGF